MPDTTRITLLGRSKNFVKRDCSLSRHFATSGQEWRVVAPNLPKTKNSLIKMTFFNNLHSRILISQ